MPLFYHSLVSPSPPLLSSYSPSPTPPRPRLAPIRTACDQANPWSPFNKDLLCRLPARRRDIQRNRNIREESDVRAGNPICVGVSPRREQRGPKQYPPLRGAGQEPAEVIKSTKQMSSRRHWDAKGGKTSQSPAPCRWSLPRCSFAG